MNQAIGEINSCLDGVDNALLMQALLNPHSGLTNVQEHNAPHYLTVLAAMKQSKEKVQYLVTIACSQCIF